MAFTLNGFGTKYHGTRWMPDGTYITTKWVVAATVRFSWAAPSSNVQGYAPMCTVIQRYTKETWK
jgi:hypothetical protein